MFLGDQGADVIKVEPLGGDGMRYKYASPFLWGLGLGKCFLGLNRNKRSISVDASADKGREIVHRLVERADVYILNMRPGTEARLGLDYETLSRINPRLVYASISGFGHEGPEARLPAYDIVIQARSGVMSTNKLPDGTPIPYVVMYADISGCMTLSYAIMVALWERERTGKGQKIDASLLHQGLAMQMQQLVWVENDESPMAGASPSAMSGSYRCSDGGHLAIVIQEERQYHALCEVLDLPEAATDPRFGTFQSRIDNAADLGELIGGVFWNAPAGRVGLDPQAGGGACGGGCDQRSDSPGRSGAGQRHVLGTGPPTRGQGQGGCTSFQLVVSPFRRKAVQARPASWGAHRRDSGRIGLRSPRDCTAP